MPVLLSFILSVLASVVTYYICKWLDRDESCGILAQTVDFSEKEGEPPKVFTVQSGVRPFVHRTNAFLSFLSTHFFSNQKKTMRLSLYNAFLL